MNPDDMTLVASLCRKRAGLRVETAKPYTVQSRLSPVARREGKDDVSHLLAAVRAGDERLAWAVVETMAAAETWFFRDQLPFDQFRDDILPALSAARGGAPIKVWSTACGSGQEAYSLAMTAQASAGSRCEIFASDISRRALEKASRGLYTQFEVQRGLPARMLVDNFERAGEAWQISERLRQAVRWRRLNLIDDLAGLPGFDVIFCRNVVSLLDETFAAKLVESLAALLPEDGVLVLGLKEAAGGLTDAVQPLPGKPGLYGKNPGRRKAA